MIKLYLSKKTHVFMITILFASQLLASSFYNTYALVTGIILSSIILLFYLGYARIHHSSIEIYALFQLLSLTIVSATMTSLFIQVILRHISLFTTLYSITLILSISMVNIIMSALYRKIKR